LQEAAARRAALAWRVSPRCGGPQAVRLATSVRMS
jgi:hypothetical protein